MGGCTLPAAPREVRMLSPTAIIADDHALTAEGIQTRLAQELNARIPAICHTGHEVVQHVRRHAPDVVILDLALPGLSGLDVLDQVSSLRDAPKVIIYSGYDEDAYVTRALRSGANGYVRKGDDPSHLVDAVKAVLSGETYLSPALPDSLADLANAPPSEANDRFDLLTDREKEVLQLVAEGLTSAEIGERLFISKRTVDKHRQNLMAKLDVNRTADLIRLALQRGVTPDPHPLPHSASPQNDD